MKNPPLHRRKITVAQRGQIIQRVIVDGWTSAAVAASFGLPKRVVDVWVADFRRHGMASLRRDSGQTIAAEMVELAVSGPARTILRRISIGLRRFFVADAFVQPMPLRRSHDDAPR